MYATFGKYVNHESTYNPDSFIFRQNKVVAYSVYFVIMVAGIIISTMEETRPEWVKSATKAAPPPTSLNVRLPKRQEKQQSALPSGRVKLNNMY